MGIRYLAHELYRATRRVEELECSLAALGEDVSLAERSRLETELYQAKKELEHYWSVLEAKKERPRI